MPIKINNAERRATIGRVPVIAAVLNDSIVYGSDETATFLLSYPACPEGFTYTVTRNASYSGLLQPKIILDSPVEPGQVQVYQGDTLTLSYTKPDTLTSVMVWRASTIQILSYSNLTVTEDITIYEEPEIQTYAISSVPTAGVQSFRLLREGYLGPEVLEFTAENYVNQVYAGDTVTLIDVTVKEGYTNGRVTITGGRLITAQPTVVNAATPKEYTLSYPMKEVFCGRSVTVASASKTLSDSGGTLPIYHDQSVRIDVWALEGYDMPLIQLMSEEELVLPTYQYSVTNQSQSVVRTIAYTFKVTGPVVLTTSITQQAPMYTVLFQKDAGVNTISIVQNRSPYEYAKISSNLTSSQIQSRYSTSQSFYKWSSISEAVPSSSVAVEGYKIDTATVNYTGLITANNQCVVSATSSAGTRATISYPATPSQISSYSISRTSSVYSRKLGTIVLSPSSSGTATTCNQTYLYVGDQITISTPARVRGFTIPYITESVSGLASTSTTAQFTLRSTASIAILVRAGVRVAFSSENESYSMGSAIVTVTSSLYQQTPATDRIMYAGDTISVPLDPENRFGTRTHRKPAVGLKISGTIVYQPNFTQDLVYTIPSSTTSLTMFLQQGDLREEFRETPVIDNVKYPLFKFTNSLSSNNEETKSWPIPMTGLLIQPASDGSTAPASFTPVSDRGPESYYIVSLHSRYYQKRYLGDLITISYIEHVQRFTTPTGSVNDSYAKATFDTRYAEYDLLEDSYISVSVTEMNTAWVANLSHGGWCWFINSVCY